MIKSGLLCLILALLINTAQAEQIAMVVAVKGAVTVQREIEFGERSANQSLKQGSLLYVGDSITAGIRSFAVLHFVDGAKVTVRPNSEMSINAYEYETDNPNAELGLVSGGLRIITGAMTKTHPDNFKVHTPVALMGV